MPYPEKQLEPEKGLLEWFGAELRHHRKLSGLSQDELGQRVYTSGSKIGKIEKAQRGCSVELAETLDRELKTGGVLTRAWRLVESQADERLSEADNDRILGQNVDADPVVRDMLDSHFSTARGESVDRRRFLAAGVGFAAGAVLADGTSTVEDPQLDLMAQMDQITTACIRMGSRRRIGRADLTRLNAVHDLYQSLDYQYGGGLVHQSMNRVADAAAVLLDSTHPDQLRNELYTTVANLRLLAGWTAFDMCDHWTGQRHFAAAERLAATTENMSLAVFVHYCQARQFQHLRHNRDAVEVLRLASDRVGTGATAGTQAVLNATIATSFAALGDREAAVQALRHADDDFGRIDASQEPPWIRWIDRAELDAQFGRVYRDFARQDRRFADEAAEWTRKAIDGFDEGMQRSSVLNQVGLCSAWFLAGEPDTALEVGAEIVAGDGQVLSQRVRERVANVSRDAGLCAGRSDVDDFIAMITPR
ncbi:helix-turn-helix domain-containing protein [Glycomyces xiaoerkulensis]|uniref:helix-turn-helix domain-containing protein n=1 Tax=Glycomyces xiaoerkulensis TaxID=2038139 RepID=UPI000C25FD1C|nr:helix-turn-helix transcriptional regulator [Glycomyces xiaoerkulensis]